MAVHKVFRMGISGSYGGWNMGDEAILQAIIGVLRRSLPVEITVLTLHGCRVKCSEQFGVQPLRD